MFTLKQAKEAHQPLAMADAFTSRERAELEALRIRYDDTHDYGEFGFDEGSLLFARWLAEHGRIGEGVDERV